MSARCRWTNRGARDRTVESRERMEAATHERTTRAKFLELHARLVAGDQAIANQLCELMVPELRRQLRQWAPRSWLEFLEDAIDDTLTALVARPARCNPRRGDPIAWLMTIARNKVIDAARAAGRRRRRELPLTDEFAAALAASGPTDHSSGDPVWVDHRRRQILAVARTDCETQFLEARMRGAPVAVQAALLGAAERSEHEQRVLVNSVWHRLRQRFVRRLTSGPGAVRE